MFYGFVFVSFKYFSFLIEMFNSDYFFLSHIIKRNRRHWKKKKSHDRRNKYKIRIFAVLQLLRVITFDNFEANNILNKKPKNHNQFSKKS